MNKRNGHTSNILLHGFHAVEKSSLDRVKLGTLILEKLKDFGQVGVIKIQVTGDLRIPDRVLFQDNDPMNSVGEETTELLLESGKLGTKQSVLPICVKNIDKHLRGYEYGILREIRQIGRYFQRVAWSMSGRGRWEVRVNSVRG
ncbi:hypothetical protein L6452_02505 [Arctium lappa]|uniref:Uncharacterized protein n=1 Tax=Arctium lappa TaxID=4217 RepID=A0ACB9FK78_ARCLA|nr:hypothetical protein L6452_02505 [Arctium lappa]